MAKTWDEITLPDKWLSQIESKLISHIDRGDTINIWGIPSIGISTQLRKISNNKGIETKIVYLDTQTLDTISSNSFYALLNSQLEDLVGEITLDNGHSNPILYTQKLISRIVESNKICIIIDTMEHLTSLEDQFYFSLKALRDKYIGKLSFILVSNKPIYEHKAFDNPKFIDFACHNEIVAKPTDEETAQKQLQEALKYFNLEIIESQKSTVLDLCGGVFGIMKSVLRILDQERDEPVNKLLKIPYLMKNRSIQTRIFRIYETFSPEEILYLKSISKNKPPKTQATNYLKKSGILDQGKIRSSLIECAISKGLSVQSGVKKGKEGDSLAEININGGRGIHIDTDTGEVYKNGTRTGNVLSSSEVKILETMRQNRNQVTTREEIGRQLWGEKYKEKYSEWAIDKAISRIRKKIGDTKRPNKYLVTIKGKGFKFHSS